MRKTKFALILLFITFQLAAIAQNQIGIIKKPEWNSSSSPYTKQGSAVALSNNSSAMLVDMPKSDFAVVNFDDRLNQKWITPLKGYALAIGEFKGNIIAVAATEGSLLKSFNSIFKAYILEAATGKILKEKIIYQGTDEYFEDPDFFFAEDGSYFKMASRITGLKRKSLFTGFINTDKKYLSTLQFNIMSFDAELNISDRISPIMPDGESWQSQCNKDGSFIITAIDEKSSKINVGTYLFSQREPLKVISIPMDFGKDFEYSPIKIASSKSPLQNYISSVYRNSKKEYVLLIAKLDFKDGSLQKKVEILDNNYFKSRAKSYVVVNKEVGKVSFGDEEFSRVNSIEEFDNKILVSLSQRILQAPYFTADYSVLLNVYDTQLQAKYQQIFPRFYRSAFGAGSDVAYAVNGKNLRILANAGSGNSVDVHYGEMSLEDGHLTKLNLITKEGIKSDYYANTKSIAWNKKSFMIPYFDQIGMLKFKVNIQLQLLTY